MDGVRRGSTSGARPQAVVLLRPKKVPAPIVQNVNASRMGIDGVRRMPSPREMLQTPQAIEADLIPQILPPQRSLVRPMIGFSIVASALLVTGLANSHLVPLHAADTFSSPQAIRSDSSAVNSSKIPNSKASLALAQATKNASLQAILDSFVSTNGSQYTIFVKDLKTGTTASVNADRAMLSASLYKLFVAQRIYQLADEGTVSLGQVAGAESNMNIENCLRLMITISDNACGRDAGSTIGWNKQDVSLKNSGYTSTTLGGGDKPQITNAKDVGLLLEHLYSGTLLSPNATNRFLGLLKEQQVNDRFPTGLPGGTIIAHKTGDVDGYTHDAGIIYGSKTDFEVVVMSGPWNSPENSKAAFGTLAGQLNSFFNN